MFDTELLPCFCSGIASFQTQTVIFFTLQPDSRQRLEMLHVEINVLLKATSLEKHLELWKTTAAHKFFVLGQSGKGLSY